MLGILGPLFSKMRMLIKPENRGKMKREVGEMLYHTWFLFNHGTFKIEGALAFE